MKNIFSKKMIVTRMILIALGLSLHSTAFSAPKGSIRVYDGDRTGLFHYSLAELGGGDGATSRRVIFTAEVQGRRGETVFQQIPGADFEFSTQAEALFVKRFFNEPGEDVSLTINGLETPKKNSNMTIYFPEKQKVIKLDEFLKEHKSEIAAIERELNPPYWVGGNFNPLNWANDTIHWVGKKFSGSSKSNSNESQKISDNNQDSKTHQGGQLHAYADRIREANQMALAGH